MRTRFVDPGDDDFLLRLPVPGHPMDLDVGQFRIVSIDNEMRITGFRTISFTVRDHHRTIPTRPTRTPCAVRKVCLNCRAIFACHHCDASFVQVERADRRVRTDTNDREAKSGFELHTTKCDRKSVKQSMKSLARRTVRFVAREWSTEIARLEKSDPDRRTTVDVDVADVLRQMNSGTSRLRLNQFYVRNHRWIAMLTERNARTATETYDFIETEMPNALFRLNQFQVLESRKDEIVELDGQILDFGVYKGDSTRALAKMFPNRTIHGFDSFEGLPEDWEHALKGDFGEVRGRLPDVPSNVCLYKGWFDDSLPAWLERNGGQNLSLLRVDCDLYSSTKTIFDVLAPIIVPGTWILFDELIGYRGWREHEYKAFMEFIEATGHGFEYIAYGLTYTLVRLKG